MDQREFFNSMADKWDSVCNHDPKKIKLIMNFAGIPSGSKVLDVGTGTGVMIPYILDSIGDTGEVTAIDVSEKMLEVAQRKHCFDNVKFVHGDALSFDLPEGYFDYIMCYSVFPHLEDKQLAISRFYKLLRTDGNIVICHSQSRYDINNLHKKTSEAVSSDNLPDIETIKSYFANTGMCPVIEVDTSEMFIVSAQK